MSPFRNPLFRPNCPPPARRHGSPTPPHAFVEPLSPPKPAPIEPQWSYPCLANHAYPTAGSSQKARANSKSRDDGQAHVHVHRSGHYRTASIDALAEAALAHSKHEGQSGLSTGHGHPYTSSMHAAYGASEPPHKRSRSDVLSSQHVARYVARPATSREALPQPESDNRVEEAALLLNFRTNGWSNSTGAAVAASEPSNSRPHSKSLPSNPHLIPSLDNAHERTLHSPFSTHPQTPHQLMEASHQSQGKGVKNFASDYPAKLERLGSSEEAVTKTEPSSLQSHDQSQALTQGKVVLDVQMADSPAPGNVAPVNEGIDAPARVKRGWPKGRSRISTTRKPLVEKPPTRKSGGAKRKRGTKTGKSVESVSTKSGRTRRKSVSDAFVFGETEHSPHTSRANSVPRAVEMRVRDVAPSKPAKRKGQVTSETICASCNSSRESKRPSGEVDDWISCNGCELWFHVDCAGFRKVHEAKDVDKFFCPTCEPIHGKTTYVRKSARAHASVDYAELQRGVLKTSEDSVEHHYIQPIKDGTFQFDPELFPRIRPELLTRDFLEKSGVFVEPICIPAAWNPRPWVDARQDSQGDVKSDPAEVAESEPDDVGKLSDGTLPDDFEYESFPNDGQDRLDMVMPQDLTVRQVANLVSPDYLLDVIDVKTQNSGSKWTLGRWADYYEDASEEKQIRNVISLEVSQTKLGRLLRRPKVVREIDLQDDVWPQEEIDRGKFPKVQFYCLMSIADSYTDFHIDFGGSSVYYHILKGKKTFFFIPPKPKHLKAYEDWNDSPEQNYTFLPNITKECYRVDLSEGDTMLIPSGWIHAVWTPETSLVIGGNFLNRMSYKNQFRVVEIEKNNETPQKFRYPHFQRIMWYTAIRYLQDDPLPQDVSQLFYEGKQFRREQPVWADFDGELGQSGSRVGSWNARYYSQAEIDGLPDLVNFIFRTVMLVMGRIEGTPQDRQKRVNASIPKNYGEPLEVAKAFALWVSWKRGNEDPPAWAHPDAVLPNSKDERPPKKLSTRLFKEMERKEAIAANKEAGADRPTTRTKQHQREPQEPAVFPVDAQTTPARTVASAHDLTSTPQPAKSRTPNASSAHSPPMHHQVHQDTPASHPMAAPPLSVMSPAQLMIGGVHLHTISTPKTSVLGPKRVACDACRRRRIKCKHKDLVVQAQEAHRLNSNGPLPFQIDGNGISSMQEGGMDETIHVSPPQDRIQSALNGVNGHVPLPGTNAYVNANIPMAVNGLPIFGEMAKKGRSKACVECRKSKRRCIHDQNGNVDPVKAAENPVPRGSFSAKKQSSENGSDSTPSQNRTVKGPLALDGRHSSAPIGYIPAEQAHAEEQRPFGSHPTETSHSRLQQDRQSDIETPDDFHELTHSGDFHPQILATSSPPQHPHFDVHHHPIDPYVQYPGSGQNGPYYGHAHHYSNSHDRQLFQLPSLEQIANEVLDMNDRGDEPTSPVGLQSILAPAVHNPAGASGAVDTVPKTAGSVDSGISLPLQDSEPDMKQGNGELESSLSTALSNDDSTNGDENQDALFATAESRDQSVPKSISNDFTEQALPTGRHSRNTSLDKIPVYVPPAPVSRPSEVVAKPAPNGLVNGQTSTSSVKRKMDSVSSLQRSPEAKKTKHNGMDQ